MDKEIIHREMKILIEKMQLQIRDEANQSFGSLDYHLKDLEDKLLTETYLSPLYNIKLPRWIGEYGNTKIEEEIGNTAGKINRFIIEYFGGNDVVNEIRKEHNKKLGF